jgi:hypothetical protein
MNEFSSFLVTIGASLSNLVTEVHNLELICGKLLTTAFLMFVFAVSCSRFEKGFGIVA